MHVAVVYNPTDVLVSNRVTEKIDLPFLSRYANVDTLEVSDAPNSLENIPVKYWKVNVGSSSIEEMSLTEKERIDEEELDGKGYPSKMGSASRYESRWWRMIVRLERKKEDWSLSDTDVNDFIRDILNDSNNLKELYCHAMVDPLIDFIDGYDTTNANFIQAIQDTLILILQG